MSIANLSSILKSGLRCPPGKRRIEYVSHERTGLYLEVRATSPGEGTYYLRYKNKSGKTCHLRLGRTTEINLDQARQKAKEKKCKITLGDYPGDDQAVQGAELTFRMSSPGNEPGRRMRNISD